MSKHTIAIASGKGGTGKTTISVSMALALAQSGESVSFKDADVEEPNAHLFLDVDLKKKSDVSVLIPEIDEAKCDGCAECQKACAFNAITVMGSLPLVFTELCHGCGACTLVCPQKAITEVPKIIGRLDSAKVDEMSFSRGILNVGEAMSSPIIAKLREENGTDADWTIIDAPPGTSCPVINSSRNVDYLILVTEPTPFGLNDLELAVGMARALELPHGVIINRANLGDREVYDYCTREQIPILLEIPFDRKIAEGYAKGQTLIVSQPEWSEKLVELAFDLVGGRS